MSSPQARITADGKAPSTQQDALSASADLATGHTEGDSVIVVR
jgi:hypothetical protein